MKKIYADEMPAIFSLNVKQPPLLANFYCTAYLDTCVEMLQTHECTLPLGISAMCRDEDNQWYTIWRLQEKLKNTPYAIAWWSGEDTNEYHQQKRSVLVCLRLRDMRDYMRET